MWIEGVRDYLSVRKFPRIELPDLTVLVGLNGSGKSHLLQAIEQGAIATDLIPPGTPRPPMPTIMVRIENGGGLPPGLTAKAPAQLAGSGLEMSPDRISMSAHFAEVRKRVLEPFEQQIRQHGFDDDLDIWRLKPEEVRERIVAAGGEVDLSIVTNIFRDARSAFKDAEVVSSTRRGERGVTSREIAEVAQLLRKDVLTLTPHDLAQRNAWGSFEIFSPNISQVFGAYRDQRAKNSLARDAVRRGEDADGLSEEDFIATFGHPPWEQVTDFLIALQLPYRVKPPSWRMDVPVSFILQRIRDGVDVAIEAVSSGERVLIRFALSIFPFDPLRVNLTVPNLLLLDEMDASLHPEMVHRWLTAIDDELVKKRGIKCILTTHSPTTVALAAEEALFEMVDGVSGPRKVTRQQALNRLTFGLPALSVDYDGRRQVFVESGTDAGAYQSLNDILKAGLNLPRTLTFMSTGPREANQEKNTGCSVVEHLVNVLSANGNKSIFGILDWDGHRESTDRIKVLAEGSHYALDNVVLNPLLIGALLLRLVGPVQGTDIKIADLATLTSAQAQGLADAIQDVLLYPPGAPAGTSPVRFLGGLEVQIRNAFAASNGHEMEAALKAAFPRLRRFQRRGDLTNAVINHVLTDWRHLTPESITRIFLQIATQELS